MSVPTHPQLSWLAAYTIGLACSAKDDDECVTELLGSVRGGVDALRAATPELVFLDALERGVRERALRLLTEAARTARAHPAGRRLVAV